MKKRGLGAIINFYNKHDMMLVKDLMSNDFGKGQSSADTLELIQGKFAWSAKDCTSLRSFLLAASTMSSTA